MGTPIAIACNTLSERVALNFISVSVEVAEVEFEGGGGSKRSGITSTFISILSTSKPSWQ